MTDIPLYITKFSMNSDGIEYTMRAVFEDRASLFAHITGDIEKIHVTYFDQKHEVSYNATDEILEALYDRWCLSEDFGGELPLIFRGISIIEQYEVNRKTYKNASNVISINEWRKRA